MKDENDKVSVDVLEKVATELDDPKHVKPEQRELAKKSIQECIDAYDCAAHYIAVMCDELGFSIKQMFEEHKNKIIERDYLKMEGLT